MKGGSSRTLWKHFVLEEGPAARLMMDRKATGKVVLTVLSFLPSLRGESQE
jgi:hypothetical protein